jgi:signal transduction histidine kinase
MANADVLLTSILAFANTQKALLRLERLTMNPGHILIVEDEKVVRHVCQLSLEKDGYDLTLAEHGLKALELLHQGKNFDIVLTDLKMPALDGMALLKAVKRDYAHIEVIIMTGFATIESAIEAMKHGAYDFIMKPIKTEQIRMVVNKCYEKIKLSHENITLREANAKLQELQEMKEKFIAITSHELRTPVSHLKGYLNIITDSSFETLNEHDKKDCLRVMQNAIFDLEQIVTNMYDVLNLEQDAEFLRKEQVNLNDLVSQVAQEFQRAARERQMHLYAQPFLRDAEVYVDRVKVKGMIAELTQNALKFTPNGGNIHFSIHEEGDFFLVNVQDSGVGIAESELGKIFEKFYEVQNTDYHSSSKSGFMGGGMGLGLSLARAIAQAHGGGIRVSSELNKGSLFQILLPKA